MSRCDVLVVGAGPAGMAAAATAAELGLHTVLLDEQPQPGGQIYRNVAHADPRVATLLGPDYTDGRRLIERLARSGAERHHDTLVWDVERDLTVTALRAGRAVQWQPARLIGATGALERPTPIPGWTLPGVLNAGAAQVAIKAAGSVPAGPVVLAGAGPLLLLVACQLLDAGATVAGVVETAAPGARRAALPHLPRALGAPGYLAKGLRMLLRLRSAGVPWFRGATELAVRGAARAESLSFRAAGRPHELAATTVLLHHGVIPNTQLARLLRLEHRWSDAQRAWHTVADAYGRTSMPGVSMAGDGVAIAGARAAEAAGALAALGAAQALGRIDAGELARRGAPLERALAAERRVRPFLDALYEPPGYVLTPADDTIVCRCEEVTAGRIREMARLGCQGPNQTKFFSRCGMGPCQGRVCGGVVTQLLAAELGRSPQAVGAYRIRAPLKPVPLASLASLVDPAQPPAGGAARESH